FSMYFRWRTVLRLVHDLTGFFGDLLEYLVETLREQVIGVGTFPRIRFPVEDDAAYFREDPWACCRAAAAACSSGRRLLCRCTAVRSCGHGAAALLRICCSGIFPRFCRIPARASRYPPRIRALPGSGPTNG